MPLSNAGGSGRMSVSKALPFLFASLNQGKFKEAAAVFNGFKLPLIAPHQITAAICRAYGLAASLGDPPRVDEIAETYAGNAALKAHAFFEWSGLPSVADDAGLEVDALDGAPGLISARFVGTHGDSQANIDKLLGLLEGQETRTARFRAVVCCQPEKGEILYAKGVLEGEIAYRQRGRGGFGYDSVFVVAGQGKTLAELKEQGVCVRTHRVMALEDLCRRLTGVIAAR